MYWYIVAKYISYSGWNEIFYTLPAPLVIKILWRFGGRGRQHGGFCSTLRPDIFAGKVYGLCPVDHWQHWSLGGQFRKHNPCWVNIGWIWQLKKKVWLSSQTLLASWGTLKDWSIYNASRGSGMTERKINDQTTWLIILPSQLSAALLTTHK